MLSQITPILLTFDEAPNIERTLGALKWAADIVVVDSGSKDGTLEKIKEMPAARVFSRPFDNHWNQWNFGLTETDIKTEWVLALDADYLVGASFVSEIAEIDSQTRFCGFSAEFEYRVFGKALPSSLYPAKVILFRRKHGKFVQDGHTQELRISGPVGRLRAKMVHDDRKSVIRWLCSQANYASLEAQKISDTSESRLSWPDRIRKSTVFAPFLILLHCLVIKRAFLAGRAGWFYTYQRTIAEMALSLELTQKRLQADPDAGSSGSSEETS